MAGGSPSLEVCLKMRHMELFHLPHACGAGSLDTYVDFVQPFNGWRWKSDWNPVFSAPNTAVQGLPMLSAISLDVINILVLG